MYMLQVIVVFLIRLRPITIRFSAVLRLSSFQLLGLYFAHTASKRTRLSIRVDLCATLEIFCTLLLDNTQRSRPSRESRVKTRRRRDNYTLRCRSRALQLAFLVWYFKSVVRSERLLPSRPDEPVSSAASSERFAASFAGFTFSRVYY